MELSPIYMFLLLQVTHLYVLSVHLDKANILRIIQKTS